LNYKVFILFVFIFTGNRLFGQSYYFRHYQVENGLSNNATICSIQDTKGFLWFGTKDGLNRFDGYTFKIFRNSPDDSGSIGSNFIHCLYEDNKGILWAGTENGVFKYDAASESFSLLKGTSNAAIRDIRMDDKGNLWFIRGFTLSRFNVQKQQLVDYDTNNYFEATSLCIDFDGTVWISTTNGFIKKYNPANNSFGS
jgi:ligand-binding sensor domain-containing protein